MTNGPDETRADDVVNTDDGGPVEPDANRRWRFLVGGIAALAVILAIVLVLVLSNDDSDNEVNTAARKATTTTSSTSTTTTTLPGTTTLATGTSRATGGTTPPTTPSGGGGASPTAPPTPTGGTTPATTVPTGPTITSYTSSSTNIACPAPDVSTTLPPTTITLTWTTQNATGVDLSVDGGGLYASYPANGNTQITVPCDGNTHTYKLTAKGTGGQTASQTISVATHN